MLPGRCRAAIVRSDPAEDHRAGASCSLFNHSRESRQVPKRHIDSPWPLRPRLMCSKNRFFGRNADEFQASPVRSSIFSEARAERRVFGCRNLHQEFYIGYVFEAENLGPCVTGSAA